MQGLVTTMVVMVLAASAGMAWSQSDEAAPAPEQKALAEQLSKRVTIDFPGTSFDNVIEFLRDMTGITIVVDRKAGEGIDEDATIRLRLMNVVLEDALNLAADQVNLECVVTDAAVLIMDPKSARNLRLKQALEKPVVMTVENKWFADILLDLHKQTGLVVTVAPEAIRLLPKGGKTPVTMRVRDVKARQVYEYLGNLVGLAFTTKDGAATYTATDDPIVGRIVKKDADGSVTELYIRRSNLPERLRQLRDEKIKALIDRLEAELKAERPTD